MLDSALGLTGLEHSTNTRSRTSSPASDRSVSPVPTGGILRPLFRLLKPHLSRLAPRPASYESNDVDVDDEDDDDDDGRTPTHVPGHAYRKQVLQIRIDQAENYDDWLAAAAELDALEGNDEWKSADDTGEYDVDLVKARLRELDDTRLGSDQGRILLLLRTALTRNLGNMGDRALYKHCRVGTKKTIERYIESVLETINTLVDISKSPNAPLDQQNVLREMIMTRQAFGRSALLLSGGGTFGMNHIGVVKTLIEANLLPRLISGASAGSIVCAVLCTRVDEEIPAFLNDFCHGDMDVFERSGEGLNLFRKAFRFLTEGCLFDISNLVRVMRNLIGDLTFLEAYNRTRRILNICVSTASLHELPRLLNYITAPNVMIWSAVAASCSVPFIYSAAQLYVKDPKTGEHKPWEQSPQKWIDGSVDNDLPMTRLAEMFNVNHFIVSQVNPHVVPFLERHEEGDETVSHDSTVGTSYASWPGWIHKLSGLAKSEAMHRMEVLQEIGFLPNVVSKLQSVLGQRYSGDITILPKVALVNFPRVLSNPDTDFMLDALLSGARATWPKLAEIRNHCAIELSIDSAVRDILVNVAFSPSQTNLRRLAVRKSSINELAFGRGSLTGGRRRSRPSRSHGTSVDLTRIRLPQRSKSKSPVRKVWFGFESMPGTTQPSPKVTSSKRHSNDETSSSSDTEAADQSTADENSDSDSGMSVSSEDLLSAGTARDKLWPSTRQIIPFASQPSTPSASRKHMTLGHLSGMTPTTRASTATPTPTASARPSSPERTYKMLFHGVQAGGSRSSPQSATVRDSGHRGLELDISGTKGMLRRRKRSLSAGLRGPKVPKTN